MDVVRLDSSFNPDSLIEGYSSMIWTERMQDHSEFELKTPLIEQTRALIPKGSYISLLDRDEIMRVESHLITKNIDTGVMELTIRGREITTVLDERMVIGNYPQTGNYPWVLDIQTGYPSPPAVQLLIWRTVVSNNPLIRADNDWLNNTAGDSKELLTNCRVAESAGAPSGPGSAYRFVRRDNLWTQVKDFLYRDKLGIRTVRPTTRTMSVYSFNATAQDHEWANTSDTTKWYYEVFDGVDRTATIIFNWADDDLTSPSYFDTIEGFKNVAAVDCTKGRKLVYREGTATTVTGFDRKILYVTGSEPGSATMADFATRHEQEGLTALAAHNSQFIFDGEISNLSAYKYKTDYFLGDTIKVLGEFGYTANMMVTEYIRTEDLEGERGFPTLTYLDG